MMRKFDIAGSMALKYREHDFELKETYDRFVGMRAKRDYKRCFSQFIAPTPVQLK
jgi:hypothetical protein